MHEEVFFQVYGAPLIPVVNMEVSSRQHRGGESFLLPGFKSLFSLRYGSAWNRLYPVPWVGKLSPRSTAILCTHLPDLWPLTKEEPAHLRQSLIRGLNASFPRLCLLVNRESPDRAAAVCASSQECPASCVSTRWGWGNTRQPQ